MMDDWKEMSVIPSKKFEFNDGIDWHYTVTAYSDVVVFEYYEDKKLKQKFDIPTFVASRMLPDVASMAKEMED